MDICVLSLILAAQIKIAYTICLIRHLYIIVL
jgi:hypothetical protein